MKLFNQNNPTIPIQKLFLSLRFYAPENFLVSAGDVIGISKASAYLIVLDVSLAIAELRKTYVQLPDTDDEIQF